MPGPPDGNAAGPFISKVINTFEGSLVMRSDTLTDATTASAAFLSPSAVVQAGALFKSALAAAAAENITRHIRRVHTAKLSVYFVALERWDEIHANATQRATPWAWPFESTKAAAFAEFARVHDENGWGNLTSLTYYNLTTMRLETDRWPKPVPVRVCDASPCPLSVWKQRLFPNTTAAG